MFSNSFDLKPPRCQISISFSIKSVWIAWPKSRPNDFSNVTDNTQRQSLDGLTLISPFAACQIFMVPSVLVDTPSPPPLEISRQVICRRVKPPNISFIWMTLYIGISAQDPNSVLGDICQVHHSALLSPQDTLLDSFKTPKRASKVLAKHFQPDNILTLKQGLLTSPSWYVLRDIN